MNKKTKENTSEAEACTQNEKMCGLVMPISGMPDCPQEHWSDVRAILESAIKNAGFESRMVSDADEVGIIHQRIVTNLYNDPIIVCDVSSKNPNVMFELGMRLAFDKPVVIVKDDQTEYSFDTGIIEHIQYPRDLRHGKIEEFKSKLARAITKTFEVAQSDDFSPFLTNFKNVTVSAIETEEVSAMDLIIRNQEHMLNQINSIKSNMLPPHKPFVSSRHRSFFDKKLLQKELTNYASRYGIELENIDVEHFIDCLPYKLRENANFLEILETIRTLQKQIETIPPKENP
ncbi:MULTISPECIES: hypothetical protein [unclassified Maridesulfovibrio]|uniref:hypothetical protein n=1 Tax=unclassified Maridesulfovibrio TaxID=2794999 RepID=UPI003B41B70B